MDILWSRPQLQSTTVAMKLAQTLSLSNTIFPYARYVRRLNLSFLANDVTDEMLSRFSPCTRLERLLLPGSINATASGLEQILAGCSFRLLSLDLSEVPCVTDALVTRIARECPGLHTLYLSSCPALTDEAIVQIATGCPHLRRIKLTQCALLTDRSIVALTKNCPQLIEMDLTGCILITNKSVQAVLAALPQVRDINFTLVTNLTYQAFTTIHPSTHRFEQLRILNFTSCSHLSDEVLTRILPAAPRLRSLALTKCDKITDLGAGAIKTLGKHLHYLHLGHCAKITDRLMINLAQHCTRIRYLDLACCSKITDATLFALAQLPKLRRIGLVKCSNITDHGLYALLVTQILPQTLERVHLSYCVNLSDVAVAALVNQCTKLTHLSLTGVPAFMSPRYQTFCRAPPPEFTAYQRYVFCVFSGRGVRELRQSMQDHPTTVAGIPIPITSIRAVAASLMVSEYGSENGFGSGGDNGSQASGYNFSSAGQPQTTINTSSTLMHAHNHAMDDVDMEALDNVLLGEEEDTQGPEPSTYLLHHGPPSQGSTPDADMHGPPQEDAGSEDTIVDEAQALTANNEEGGQEESQRQLFRRSSLLSFSSSSSQAHVSLLPQGTLLPFHRHHYHLFRLRPFLEHDNLGQTLGITRDTIQVEEIDERISNGSVNQERVAERTSEWGSGGGGGGEGVESWDASDSEIGQEDDERDARVNILGGASTPIMDRCVGSSSVCDSTLGRGDHLTAIAGSSDVNHDTSACHGEKYGRVNHGQLEYTLSSK
ncbi:SCF ubiquitin ligase complex subunit [Podila humilis]|nr:SCF ubiquitin ligase complex subunit [Podila humilis]